MENIEAVLGFLLVAFLLAALSWMGLRRLWSALKGMQGRLERLQRSFAERAARMERQGKADQEHDAAQRQRKVDQEREAAQRERERQREADKKQQEARQSSERQGAQGTHRSSEWWEVLGVSPQASLDEIRTSYAAKIKQYHPDRLNGMGPELLRLAEERTRELNAALAAARRARPGR